MDPQGSIFFAQCGGVGWGTRIGTVPVLGQCRLGRAYPD